MPLILHEAENFLVAELPVLANGLKPILTKFGDDVRLHLLSANGQPTQSNSLPMEVIETIYRVTHPNG